SGFIPKVMNMLNYVSFGLIALVGGLLAINGAGGVTVGIIVIFTEYARQFTRPLNELSNQFNILLTAERVFTIMDEKPEEMDEQDAKELPSTLGHVVFDQVSFGYEDTPILKQISFEAKPGESIAFIGHTGAGKTTIINLISRFYNYDTGKISLDGYDIKYIKRS